MGHAAAQGLDPDKIKKILHFNTLSDEQFIAQTDLFKDSPQGDKLLAYTIRLPKGWKKGSGERLSEAKGRTGDKNEIHRILGKVGKYYGPQVVEFPSHIEIEALGLDYDISARNWFLNYILSNGYTLEGMEQINKNRIEGLYVLVQGDTSYVVRTIAQINGPRMVLASYYLPEKQWDAEKAIQEKVVESFQFDRPEQVRAEATHTYPFLDLLRFDYPASWRLLAPNIDSVEGMDARLMNSKDDKIINGEIDLHIVSTGVDTTLAEEVQGLRKNLGAMGLKIGSLIEVPADYNFHKHIYYNRVEVYEVRSKGSTTNDVELWLAIMVEDRYYYIISMITPGRNKDFLMWARNIESFQTVIETIRP
jgi:hypothetical protein